MVPDKIPYWMLCSSSFDCWHRTMIEDEVNMPEAFMKECFYQAHYFTYAVTSEPINLENPTEK
jgi:hypothetical protein